MCPFPISDEVSLLLDRIVEEIAGARCALFVGAGLSMGSGLPGWKELVVDLAQALGCAAEADPLTIAQAYQQRYDRATLIDKIWARTDTTGKQPTKVHELLPELGITTWITTNFDDLLETTLKQANCPFRVVYKDTHIPYSAARETVVIKLHGDRNDADSIVFTKNDYSAASQKRPLLWDSMKLALARKTLLFIGYSLADPDFSQLQAWVLNALGSDNYRGSYAIMFDVDRLRRADLEARRITVIDLGCLEGVNATNAICDLLSAIVERLACFPYIPAEHHSGDEAEHRVPARVKAELEATEFRLKCCVEYHVYCEYFDEREFSPIPQYWEPPLPSEFRKPEYRCIRYRRTDEELMNIWVGWAVGRGKH